MKQSYMRQIRVPFSLYKEVKNYCISRKIKLISFYDQMISWYFKNTSNVYYASYKKGYNMSLWISDAYAAQIKKEAEQANVSEARVVFTALVLYLKHLNYLDYTQLMKIENGIKS